MNYRHAFHAGNFADCMKHALLVWLIDALQRKPAPIFVLDTHAGAGAYDLKAGPAERTGEWRGGVARVVPAPPPPNVRDVSLLQPPSVPPGTYPGSPLLVRTLLRHDDLLAACELHAEDYAALRRLFGGDKQVGVHRRDGWEALRALLPPKQTRGLVLIDPPYEAPDDLGRVLAGLQDGATRFNHGVYAAWYPIKHRSPVTTFHESVRLSGLRDVVAAELLLRAPTDPQRLNGCGLLVRNPPYGFEPAASAILASLLSRLGGEAGKGTDIIRLIDE